MDKTVTKHAKADCEIHISFFLVLMKMKRDQGKVSERERESEQMKMMKSCWVYLLTTLLVLFFEKF